MCHRRRTRSSLCSNNAPHEQHSWRPLLTTYIIDDKIISMYARGMTCREIKAHLEEIYGVEVSPDLISTVTDSVIDEVRSWQSRPLSAVYPILYLDALQVKVKDQGLCLKQSHLPCPWDEYVRN